MKKFICFLLLGLSLLKVNSAEISDSLQLSMLTVSPGNELYSTFGHTAIRLVDYKNNNDLVFNYGTFDFSTPNFYLKFALGLLDYQLSIESFENFKSGCLYENRCVTEQVLRLDKLQKMKMVDLLIANYQPENRKYRYKFFTDNCSTRPRDIISQTLGDSSILESTGIEKDKTFRQLFTSYLPLMPWSRFGIELLLGKMTDQKAGYDALFLPDNLKSSIDAATIKGNTLEKSESKILDCTIEKSSTSWFSPMIMAILILMISVFIQFRKSWAKKFDSVFFVIFGILGLFIALISFASYHHEVQKNFVVLFILPLVLIIPFLKEKRSMVALICFSIIILSFVSIPILPQKFNPAVLLLSLALAIRCFFNFAEISTTGIKRL